MIALITGVVGLISTILVYFWGPQAGKRKIYTELDFIYKSLEELYRDRDKALQDHNDNNLTRITALIISMCKRKTILLQRLG